PALTPLMRFSGGKKTRNQHQHHRSHSPRRQAVYEPSAPNAQLRKNPAAQNRPHHSDRQVPQAPETCSPADFARDPSRQQSDDDPSQQRRADGDPEKMNHYSPSIDLLAGHCSPVVPTALRGSEL